MSWDAETRFRVSDRVRSREVAGETVLLDLEGGIYYALDEVGTEIWNGLKGGETLAALEERILDRYEVEPDRLSSDLRRLLQELVEKDLIVEEP